MKRQINSIQNCKLLEKEENSIQREIDALKQTMKIDSQSGFLDEFLNKKLLLTEMEYWQIRKKSNR